MLGDDFEHIDKRFRDLTVPIAAVEKLYDGSANKAPYLYKFKTRIYNPTNQYPISNEEEN